MSMQCLSGVTQNFKCHGKNTGKHDKKCRTSFLAMARKTWEQMPCRFILINFLKDDYGKEKPWHDPQCNGMKRNAVCMLIF